MTEREVEALKRAQKRVKTSCDPIASAALVSIEYLLECAREDARREQRARKGW